MENFILMVSENKSGVDWIRLADIVRGKMCFLVTGRGGCQGTRTQCGGESLTWEFVESVWGIDTRGTGGFATSVCHSSVTQSTVCTLTGTIVVTLTGT